MRSMKGWSLGRQFALGFALITVLTLGIVGSLLVNQISRRQLAERTAKVLDQARVAADLAAEVRFAQNPAGLPLALFNFHLQSGVRPIVVGADGTVVADSWIPSPLAQERLELPEVSQALQGQEAHGYRQIGAREWALYVAVPMPVDQRVGRAVLVSADLTDLALGLRQTRLQLIWGLTAGGIVAVLAGFLLAHHFARPLRRLDATVGALAQGEFAARVQPEGSREVRDLGERFNLMAAELARLDAQRRNYVAAASHEMRTPVATIRALAEALQSDRQGDLALYKEYLGDIIDEADHARALLERLLELARLEGESNLRPLAPVDLGALCADLIDSLLPLAEHRGINLSLRTDKPPAWAMGDAFLIETVLTNLVENGLKYTPAGGQVSVSITANATEARITVQDTGPGIPPEHLPHLFERFYRVDTARARPTGGVGLGLAIVTEAARLLNGQLAVESTLGEGSAFALILQTTDTES